MAGLNLRLDILHLTDMTDDQFQTEEQKQADQTMADIQRVREFVTMAKKGFGQCEKKGQDRRSEIMTAQSMETLAEQTVAILRDRMPDAQIVQWLKECQTGAEAQIFDIRRPHMHSYLERILEVHKFVTMAKNACYNDNQ